MLTTMNLGRRMRALGGLGAAVLAPLVVSGCMMGGPSRTAQGQLYTSGNPTYDTLFHDVHQQQVDAASWSDDKKGAHRALVSALELTPDAPDVTIVQATHEGASKVAKQPGSVKLDVDGTAAHVVGGASDGGTLFHAIEDTAHAELERAKRLRALMPKLDALNKQATDLQDHVKGDFESNGLAKQNEVTGELMSTTDVVSKLRTRAEREARESEDFVADMERALETASEASAAKQVARRKKKSDKSDSSSATAASRPAPSPPSADPATPPAPKAAAPPPPPAPKPADTGEVFTP